ncbi:hypothetical protein V2J09_006260 [Rumex salicifolius]
MDFAISICNSIVKSATAVSCKSPVDSPTISSLPPLTVGRRTLVGVLFSSTATALPAAADDSRSLLLQKYLKKSEENKIKNDKEDLRTSKVKIALTLVQ